jgi:hypothetical protein
MLSPYYTSIPQIQLFEVQIIQRSATNDMAAMLLDMHFKDATH